MTIGRQFQTFLWSTFFGLQSHCGLILILFAIITGNSSLEPLLEGLWSQIHTDLSSRFSAGIEPGTYR